MKEDGYRVPRGVIPAVTLFFLTQARRRGEVRRPSPSFNPPVALRYSCSPRHNHDFREIHIVFEDFSGADSARRHLDAQIAAAEAKLQRAKELETKVQNLKGRASSRRGEVSVTVDSSGGLSDLKLTDAATALTASDLAGLILETFHKAHRKVTESYVDMVNDEFGKDSPTARAAADEAWGRVTTDVDDEDDNKKAVSNLWRRR